MNRRKVNRANLLLVVILDGSEKHLTKEIYGDAAYVGIYTYGMSRTPFLET
jgi:hypothetical protein